MSRHFAHANRLQRHWNSHVLLYHSVFHEVPGDLRLGLHNVTPDALREQISWLKTHFEIVTVDELFANPKPGKAAITFDDGYASVFEHGLPVLKELNVPCTIFLNGCSLQGRPFWRDKVRYVINAALIREFLESYQVRYGESDGMTHETFYRASKYPSVNSKKVDLALDAFLEERHIYLSRSMHCVSDPALLVRDPLVTYGNHTMNHYVLASLADEDQRTEILDNHRLLDGLNIPLSRILSIPFGDETDFNRTSIAIAEEAGYAGFLYSRNRVNTRHRASTAGLPSLERYMAPPGFADFQKQLLGMWIRTLTRGF